MKKLISLLLSAAMMVSTFAVVNAEEESILISTNKPVTAGIIDGESHNDTKGFAEASIMVNGDTSITTWDKNEMWFEHSSVDGKMIYFNLDLQDIYTITKISWNGRYSPEENATSAKYDWWNMKIYGANKSDYSDKKLIYTTGGDNNTRDVDFEIAAEDIAEYRYIRFEKETTMGGQEIRVYGYKNPASNANLSALSVDGYNFDSAFSVSDTEYTVVANGFPTDNTVTVTATAESGTATVTGTGTVTVSNYGANTIPVTVTSEDGTQTKTYNINFIVTELDDVSARIVSATGSNVYNNNTVSDANCLKAFTGSVTRTKVWIKGGKTGYIQIDLGAKYNLSEFAYTKSNLEKVAALTIQASNNPDSGYTDIGTSTANADKTITAINIPLKSENAYQYLRIGKLTTTNDFLPLTMRLYALPQVQQITDVSAKAASVIGSNVRVGYNSTEINDSNCASLLTGSVKRTDVWVLFAETGYVQINLDKAYNLSKFVWTKSNLEKGPALTIKASNDANFETEVTLGSIAALAKTETSATAALDSSTAYQYIRVEKSTGADFLPLTMRLYASPAANEVTVGTSIMSVPSLNYAVGDMMLAIVYNADGTLKSVTPATAQNEATTDIEVTKAAGETSKVLVWNNYSAMAPRMAAANVQ